MAIGINDKLDDFIAMAIVRGACSDAVAWLEDQKTGVVFLQSYWIFW